MTQTRRDAGKGRILAGTPGPQRVAVFGVFDGIHAGHQDFLRQAREYGDEVVVIVARDKSVTQLKGKPPIHPEGQRLGLLSQEQWVSRVILGDEEPSNYRALADLKPDVVCFGYDQLELMADLTKWMEANRQETRTHLLEPYQPLRLHNSLLRR